MCPPKKRRLKGRLQDSGGTEEIPKVNKLFWLRRGLYVKVDKTKLSLGIIFLGMVIGLTVSSIFHDYRPFIIGWMSGVALSLIAEAVVDNKYRHSEGS